MLVIKKKKREAVRLKLCAGGKSISEKSMRHLFNWGQSWRSTCGASESIQQTAYCIAFVFYLLHVSAAVLFQHWRVKTVSTSKAAEVLYLQTWPTVKSGFFSSSAVRMIYHTPTGCFTCSHLTHDFSSYVSYFYKNVISPYMKTNSPATLMLKLREDCNYFWHRRKKMLGKAAKVCYVCIVVLEVFQCTRA